MRPKAEMIWEALGAAIDLDRALLAATKLLMQCSCQNKRRREALAAIDLAERATRRWEAVTRQMREHAQRQQGSTN